MCFLILSAEIVIPFDLPAQREKTLSFSKNEKRVTCVNYASKWAMLQKVIKIYMSMEQALVHLN